MKLILPIAGEGRRLRPHTYTLPKVLLQVGNKPILAHILDELLKSLAIEESIFIVGRFGEKVKDYIKEHYRIKATYIEQEIPLGLGHAVFLAKDRFDKGEPAVIVYGDTLFKANLKNLKGDCDGYIGVKEVDDPKRFGVVEMDGNFIKRLIEKPKNPTSNLAVVGVNYISNTKLLFESLEDIIKNNKKTRGEFQLTDAFQTMVEGGTKLKTFEIKEWYDCGKPDTLLLTNRRLLEEDGGYSKQKDTVILPPVYIHPDARVETSIIGPYVSIAENARIKSSIISDSIIGKDANIENLLLTSSIIGNEAICKGKTRCLNIGDSSIIEVA